MISHPFKRRPGHLINECTRQYCLKEFESGFDSKSRISQIDTAYV